MTQSDNREKGCAMKILLLEQEKMDMTITAAGDHAKAFELQVELNEVNAENDRFKHQLTSAKARILQLEAQDTQSVQTISSGASCFLYRRALVDKQQNRKSPKDCQ